MRALVSWLILLFGLASAIYSASAFADFYLPTGQTAEITVKRRAPTKAPEIVPQSPSNPYYSPSRG